MTLTANFSMVAVPRTQKPGETAIYRSPYCPDKITWDNPAKADTLYGVYDYAYKKHANHNMLGAIKPGTEVYEWKRYKQIQEERELFGSGLLHLYEKHVKKTYKANKEICADRPDCFPLGIYSINRPEWVIAEHACVTFGLISIPLYDTFGPDAVQYIINHGETPIIVSSIVGIPNILKCADKCPVLKSKNQNVVYISLRVAPA